MKLRLGRCMFAALLSLCVASEAYADGFDVRQFYPIMGSEGVFSVESSKTLKHLDYDIKLMTDYENTPFQFDMADDGTAKLEHLVTMNLSASLGVLDFLEVGVGLPFIAYEGFNDKFETVPRYVVEQPKRGIVGDMQVRAKGTILKREDYSGFGLGAGVILSIPTGKQSGLVGDASFWGRPYVALDYEIGPVEMMLNAGFTFRKKAEYLDYTSSHGFNYGFGVNYHVVPDWLDLKGEIFGETPMSKKATEGHHQAAEFLLGTKLLTPIGLHVTAGAGAGIGDGTKNPKYQVLLGLEYQPNNKDTDEDGVYDRKDVCLTTPGVEEFEGCPNPDVDEDGWCDKWLELENEEVQQHWSCQLVDVCPEIAGIDEFEGCPNPDVDKDGWCDEWITDQEYADRFECRMTDACPTLEGSFEGCPNPDSDNDGWCDPWITEQKYAEKFNCQIADKCPDIPGENEYSGCPNADVDADGLCASFVEEKGLFDLYFCTGNDVCPDKSEDFDDFEDDDGCPEPDNDHDGFCDPWVSEQGLLDLYKDVCRGLDNCPLEPETINGIKDDDGCPDKGKQLVFVLDDKIEIKDVIYFDNNKATIKKKSNSLLNQIAATMLANPDIKHVSVEGHTDDTGKYERNIVLSRQRAESVVNYLIGQGVTADRLSAVGYGPDRPIDPAKTKKARALNRRVEFVIKDRKK
ncbi:MAG: OmpA family protein [Proteobacteria bacterium]|nr:OmpA family protein [Pseudomonadota bacterium]